MEEKRTVRLDLVKDGEVVLIVRREKKPFKVVEKDNYNKKVKGIWLLTGEDVYLSGGEATLSIDDNWKDFILEKLESKKSRIDKTIKMIKSIDKQKNEKKLKKNLV